MKSKTLKINNYPIKKEWGEYYLVLEGIRRTGVCNMYGSAGYLKEFCPELTEDEAQAILINWMVNYDELGQIYDWKNN